MKDEIIIRISEDKTISVDISENGSILHKNISPDALVNALVEGCKEEEFHSGVLPKNVLSVSLKSNMKYITMDFPEKRADLAYLNTLYDDFPIPHFVFGFKVNSFGRIEKVCIGITEPGELSEQSEMYYYPFGNVTGFSLCIGQNTLPTVTNLKALERLPYLILGFPSNDDSFRITNNRLELSQRELMEHLRGKSQEYYYSDILKPMNVKFKKFLKGKLD